MRKYIMGLVLIPFIGFSQQNSAVLIDNYMQEQGLQKKFSGVVFISQKDKIIYKKAFGLANKEWNIPNTLYTKFRIGSNTKQMTAAAILKLIDQGMLTLDDKLKKYFPDFPRSDSVTIRMLLNHTSGIRNYNGIRNFPFLQVLPYSRDSVVGLFKNAPYEFSPGSKWAYNNSAYFLLGYIIEKLTGQSYNNYIASLFSKAGMHNSGVDKPDSILQYRASGYEKKRTEWKNASYVSMEIPFSAGSIYSTAEDMYLWNKALHSGKIISDQSLSLMTTPALNYYGFGVRIDSFHNHKRIGHGGSIPGFESLNVWFPKEELSIVLLSNNESDVMAIAEDIQALVFRIPKVIMYTSQLNTFAGTYQSINNTLRLRFIRNGNTIRFVSDQEEFDLYPTSPNTFINGFARRRFLSFVKAENGKIKLQFTRNGVTIELDKIE